MAMTGELTDALRAVGARAMTRGARSWVAVMRVGADSLAPEGFNATADAAECALDAEGPWGLVDLALAGPADGGLTDEDVSRLLAHITAASAA